MGRRLALGLTLACLLALSVAVSVEEGDKRSDLATALTKPAGKSAGKAAPKQGVLDRAKNIAKDLIDKGKQLIGGVRALVKKEIEHVKTWFKKKWADIKQIYQFSRYCLNNKAPKKLKIKVPNSALCSTVRKSHPEFVQALEKIIEKVPEPTLQQTLAAEMAGEGDMHRKKPSASGSRRSFLEIDSTNPGDPTHKWPTTLISYSLHPDLDPRAVVSLQWGVNHLEAVTCIRFQQVDTNATGAVIRVIPSTARCASELGYKGATGQNMWWGPQCAAGSSAHEFLHALGFDHTMNRLDRDLYLSVNLTRILTNKQHNFDKQSSPFQNYGPYDFLSILHYPANAFALRLSEPGLAEKTGRDSSVPAALNSPWNGQSQRDALTAGDIAAVKAIYCP